MNYYKLRGISIVAVFVLLISTMCLQYTILKNVEDEINTLKTETIPDIKNSSFEAGHVDGCSRSDDPLKYTIYHNGDRGKVDIYMNDCGDMYTIQDGEIVQYNFINVTMCDGIYSYNLAVHNTT